MRSRRSIKTINKEIGQAIMEEAGSAYQTHDAPPVCETVSGWLEKGFKNYPQRPAIRLRGESLSYRNLEKLANRIANYLIERGTKKGDKVGISLRRSFEMVGCMIGIFKAGAVFVPLDPNYPADRIAMMKEDANLDFIIAHQSFINLFDKSLDKVVFWEQIEDKIQTCVDAKPPVSIGAEDIAYIVFTSGSTGRPKGIKVPHRSLSNVVEAQVERDYFKKEARLLQYSSISVDVSFQGIITTLATGGTVYLVSDRQQRDARILLKKINEYKIERIFVPYVAFRSLVEVATATNSYPIGLREVITAGEQLRVDDAVREFFTKISGAVLDNQYGASETHVLSSNVLKGDPTQWPDLPSVGTPLKNASIYILDENMQPVANGQKGELYLAGRTLACGYIGRDDLTKKSFIKNPFDDNNRPVLYKSGDLGAYNDDGSIELLGRLDHQIKIRGYRVEPGEINNIGAKFSGIAQCITHVYLDHKNTPYLTTYYINQKDTVVKEKEFRAYLADSLPDYMVPAFLIQIEEIPYTPSGKVDFKSLPEPKASLREVGDTKEVHYQTATEAQLAHIWSEVLGFKAISRTSDYFNLGGDSLSAVTLFLKIEKQFGKALPLSALAKAPTIEKLAKLIEAKDEETDFSKFRSLQVIQKGDKNKVPLFMVHGGGGNVLLFNELAKGLDPDQPVFAFQWTGWAGYQGMSDICEMAELYKKELLEAWPSGPYRLGGHCSGGIVALELAKLLEADGAEVVGPVLVCDAPNMKADSFCFNEPGISDETFAKFNKNKKELKSNIPRYFITVTSQGSESSNEHKRVLNDVKNYSQLKSNFKNYRLFRSCITFIKLFKYRCSYHLRKMSDSAFRFYCWCIIKLSKQIPMQKRGHYSTVMHRHALRKYKKTVYEKDVLYLRSSTMRGRMLGLQGWWDDIYMGFGEICSGDFDGQVIGGDHKYLLRNSDAHEIIENKILCKTGS